MKIYVKPRIFIEQKVESDLVFVSKYNFISIFSSEGACSNCFSPLPARENVLRLQFDDITDDPALIETINKFHLILFNESLAKQIKNFADRINKNKILYVHCDAGVSRSGAVGICLNDYFNRYLQDNQTDNEFFKDHNKAVQPNPFVSRILNKTLFGGY